MSDHDLFERHVRVLVTGAGGPAAISVMKSLGNDPTVDLVAADMDPWAAGLYLVRPDARTLIPAGLDPGFAVALLARCVAMGVNIVVPTVDSEMRPLDRARADFADAGIELLLAPGPALAVTLDKLALARRCAGHVRVPRTECFDAALDPGSWTYPVVVKPRTGSGSRDISIVESSQALAALDTSTDFLVQEYLPGEEYSIDVLADATGRVVSSVPRVRSRVDSGVSLFLLPVFMVAASGSLIALYFLNFKLAFVAFRLLWITNVVTYAFITSLALFIDPDVGRRTWRQAVMFPGIINVLILSTAMLPAPMSWISHKVVSAAGIELTPGWIRGIVLFTYIWLMGCMGVSYLAKVLEPHRVGKILCPILLYVSGYGPLLCAITTAAYVQEFRKADMHWDKTVKTGKVAAPA